MLLLQLHRASSYTQVPIENLEKELSPGFLQPLQGSSWLYAAVGGGAGAVAGVRHRMGLWEDRQRKDALGVESPHRKENPVSYTGKNDICLVQLAP